MKPPSQLFNTVFASFFIGSARKKAILAVFSAALTLTACDSKKEVITGDRVPVVNYESSLQVDSETKSLSVSLPLPEMARDWPQVAGGASHVIPHVTLNDSFQPHWTASIGSGNGEGRFLSSPIISEGVIYALDTSGRVSAFEALSGKRLWQTDISPADHQESIIGGGLACGEGKVFVTSPHAEILSLDGKTGKILWRVSTQSPVRAAPTLADGRVFILTISNQLDVFSAETGERLWDHAGITEYAGLLGTASPAVSKGVAIVTYSSGEIFSLKAENGHTLWTETLSNTRRPDSLSSLSHIRALPVIDKDLVLVIGHNQKMAAYDLRRGERLWERHIGGIRTPVVAGEYIFMVTSHNELLCLTRDFGQVVWVKKLEEDTEHPYKVMWEGPLLAGNKLYLVNTKGKLVAFHPANGTQLSERQLGGTVSLSPLVAQETLYILMDNGELAAFK